MAFHVYGFSDGSVYLTHQFSQCILELIKLFFSFSLKARTDRNTTSKHSSACWPKNGVRKMFVLLALSVMFHSFAGEKKMKQSQQGPSTGKRFEAEGGMDKPGSNKLLSNKKSR
jgi:hypothetical protein